MAQTITMPSLSLTQNYTYDSLNRISTAGEGSSSWSQTYGYDSYGNRYVSADSGFSLTAFTPTAASNFSTSTNRLGVNSAGYDNTGNQSSIGGYTYSYDAEGRLITANLASGSTQVSSAGYVYDGDGQRVQKIICPAGTNPCTPTSTGATFTDYVYDAWGNLQAEYTSSTPPVSMCNTAICYVSVDQIGSTRLVTDSNGDVTGRYDYLPFGEEISSGIGGRTTGMGYRSALDGFSPKFTGQMRDTENLLDYFNARYYSPAQGRFVSPDPENAGADVTDPQTWNGYSYVVNDPLTLTDPSGQGFWGDLGWILGGAVASFIPGANALYWAIFGFAAGEAVDVTQNGLAGLSPIPWLGVNTSLSGVLGGCGGPLGSCGDLGSNPWSEDAGLQTVQNPDRFIMDATNNSTTQRLACAAEFGQNHSIAAAFGAQNNFLGSLLGGNTVSRLVNLWLFISGDKTPTSAQLAAIPLKGAAHGIPVPPGNPGWSGAMGQLRGMAVQSAVAGTYNAIAGVGQETIELGITASGTVAAPVAQLGTQTLTNVATGVGVAKFAFDLGTFLYGLGVECR